MFNCSGDSPTISGDGATSYRIRKAGVIGVSLRFELQTTSVVEAKLSVNNDAHAFAGLLMLRRIIEQGEEATEPTVATRRSAAVVTAR